MAPLKCLDTYALIELARGNKDFLSLLEKDFAIVDVIMAEFYGVVLREFSKNIADIWYKKLSSYVVDAPTDILIKAIIFRAENKKSNFSFFDCVGYVFSVENGYKFVTGDEAFKGMKGVDFRK